MDTSFKKVAELDKRLWRGNGFKAVQCRFDSRYGLHEKVTPEAWWQSALGVDLDLNPGGRVRIKAGNGGTFLIPICSVPKFCKKHLNEKIAFSVAVMKKTGQDEGNMDYPEWR